MEKKTKTSGSNDYIFLSVVILIVFAIGFIRGVQEKPSQKIIETVSASQYGMEEIPSKLNAIDDYKARVSFAEVADKIGMNMEYVRHIVPADDNSYTFSYKMTPFTISTDAESNVVSVKEDALMAEIYSADGTAEAIDDYVVSSSLHGKLISMTDKMVRASVAHPVTAEIPLMRWNFAREKNFYFVTNTVSVDNEIHQLEEESFCAIYNVDGDSITPVFFEIGDEVKINDLVPAAEIACI